MGRLLLPLLLALAACGPRSAGGRDDTRCNRGEYFVPGCSDDPGLVAGCYERCAHAACSPGTTCGTVTVMPACALADGDAICDACGEEVELCLPSAGD